MERIFLVRAITESELRKGGTAQQREPTEPRRQAAIGPIAEAQVIDCQQSSFTNSSNTARKPAQVPYTLIASAVVIILAIRFLVMVDVPVRAKTFVAVVLLISFVAQFGFPQWHLVALVLQVSLGIGLVLHSKLTPKSYGGKQKTGR